MTDRGADGRNALSMNALRAENVAGALHKNKLHHAISVMVSTVKCQPQAAVVTSRRNDCSEVFALADEGRAFQARAAATGKARSPRVERLVEGMHCVEPSMLKQTGDGDELLHQ